MSARRLAWALWALAVVLLPAGPLWQALEGTGAGDVPFMVGLVAVQLAAASAGAVIASRLPGNAVGWIFLALGAGLGFTLACGAWAELGLDTSHGPLPGDEAAAWLASWLFLPVALGLPLFLLLLFPDGRYLSRRWRRLGLLIGSFIGVACVVKALVPGRIEPGLQNPLAPGGALGEAIDVLDLVNNILSLPAFLLAATGLALRLRRSRGVERQQLKWFTYAAALASAGMAGSGLVPTGLASDALLLVGLLALAALPVATGMAILRYRLYDIDVVINRTLVYGALTATLAAAYVASVLLLQLVLSPGSDLAIAASTLAVAALFGPARARIQAGVDRRSYRRRYDARRTHEAFAGRMRDEVALDALTTELRDAVVETMQSAHLSLWVRPR
jgi:hypothetical protein